MTDTDVAMTDTGVTMSDKDAAMTSTLSSQGSQKVKLGSVELTLRDVTPGDREAVTALHTLVFGPNVDGAWFAWKYGDAIEQGQGQALGVWHGGELIAYCGGLPRTLWRQGKAVRGLQIGDVMVHPQWRGILSRRGPFFQVSRHFYDSRLGVEQTSAFQLGFGFPNERHLRLAVMLGLLRDGGEMECLHWRSRPTDMKTLPWNWCWHALEPSDKRFESAVSGAWAAMRASAHDLSLGQRDAAYLRWRFAQRPPDVGTSAEAAARYRFFALRRRWSNNCVGIAVLDLRSNSAHWLDWVGPLKLMPLVSLACRLEAARAGAAELTAWASQAVAGQLADTGITQREVCAKIGIPCASDLKSEAVSGLRWWFMGGDTDFL